MGKPGTWLDLWNQLPWKEERKREPKEPNAPSHGQKAGRAGLYLSANVPFPRKTRFTDSGSQDLNAPVEWEWVHTN